VDVERVQSHSFLGNEISRVADEAIRKPVPPYRPQLTGDQVQGNWQRKDAGIGAEGCLDLQENQNQFLEGSQTTAVILSAELVD
jgi:hypothetical protein